MQNLLPFLRVSALFRSAVLNTSPIPFSAKHNALFSYYLSFFTLQAEVDTFSALFLQFRSLLLENPTPLLSLVHGYFFRLTTPYHQIHSRAAAAFYSASYGSCRSAYPHDSVRNTKPCILSSLQFCQAIPLSNGRYPD